MGLFDRILRAGEGKKLKTLHGVVEPINSLEPEFGKLSDVELAKKTAEFRERLEQGEHRSPFYFHLSVDDRPGVLAHVAEALAARDVSIARILQHANGDGAAIHVVTHEAREGSLDDALAAISALAEVRKQPLPYPVVSARGISELGWA